MRILVVSRYKAKLESHVAAFVAEQTVSLQETGCDVELFLLRGNYWEQWKSLRAKIREYKPDVVHAHYGLSCLVANLATRRVPVVSTYHGSDINVKAVRRLSKIAMRLSAWNIFVSQRNVDMAKPRKHWSLIPCGVALSDDQLQTRDEARKALGWSVDEKKVLFAGAFDNGVKDPELAEQAVERVNVERVNEVELIELKGYTREQVNTLLCAVDCLLMTSKTEGSPQVIKEAMACGCPIVSVDVGDVKERLHNLEGCFVVPIGDRSLVIGNLAEALKQAMAFKGKTNGRLRIVQDSLSCDLVAQKLIEIYENII